jgi:Xaa-Pro aminopeptidase
MKGDTDEIVENGAYALFFPHGLGHLMGLDVHDMENYGEDNVGYDEKIKRSGIFGPSNLRYGLEIKENMVLTDEPGIYFIPQLIELWKKENKFKDFINYDKALKYKDFGGVRIEDDLLITADGCKVLGKPVAKTGKDVEAEIIVR